MHERQVVGQLGERRGGGVELGGLELLDGQRRASTAQIAGLDVPIEPVTTTIAPGSPDRPLNGVLARPGADALGIPALRPWREALEDYMGRAGLAT